MSGVVSYLLIEFPKRLQNAWFMRSVLKLLSACLWAAMGLSGYILLMHDPFEAETWVPAGLQSACAAAARVTMATAVSGLPSAARQ